MRNGDFFKQSESQRLFVPTLPVAWSGFAGKVVLMAVMTSTIVTIVTIITIVTLHYRLGS